MFARRILWQGQHSDTLLKQAFNPFKSSYSQWISQTTFKVEKRKEHFVQSGDFKKIQTQTVDHSSSKKKKKYVTSNKATFLTHYFIIPVMEHLIVFLPDKHNSSTSSFHFVPKSFELLCHSPHNTKNVAMEQSIYCLLGCHSTSTFSSHFHVAVRMHNAPQLSLHQRGRWMTRWVRATWTTCPQKHELVRQTSA